MEHDIIDITPVGSPEPVVGKSFIQAQIDTYAKQHQETQEQLTALDKDYNEKKAQGHAILHQLAGAITALRQLIEAAPVAE